MKERLSVVIPWALKEEYKLKKEIFVLEQKGATRDDVAPLQEKLGIYRSIREALEINGVAIPVKYN